MPIYKTAANKAIQISASTKPEVEAQLATLAEETIDYVYGSVIREVTVTGEVRRRYDVHVSVRLEKK